MTWSVMNVFTVCPCCTAGKTEPVLVGVCGSPYGSPPPHFAENGRGSGRLSVSLLLDYSDTINSLL